MTIEKKIGEHAAEPAAADSVRRDAQRIDEFLASVEPFFYQKPISYVDVGAHKGDVFRAVLEAGQKIRRAHLIEPNPASFALLEAAVATTKAAEHTTCLNRAVSDHAGVVTLRDAGTMTRVVEPAAADGLAEETSAAWPGQVFEVEAITLDALAAEFDRPQISLLKIDVEGHEAEVLAGARGLLAEQAIDMIYVEAGMNPEGSGQQTYYRAIEDRLAAHGYRLFRIFEQKHEWQEDSPFLRRVNLAFMSPRFAAAHPYNLCTELLGLRKESARLERARAASEAETAGLTAQLDTERRAREAAAARLAELDQALAEARREAEKAQAERQKAQASVASERQKAERAKAELAKLRSYGRKLEAQHRALLQSHTWQAMEPVRRALRLLRGRKAPATFTPRLGSGAGRAAASKGRPRRAGGAKRKPGGQDPEIARCVHHLWGGLAAPAVRELTRAMEDPARPEAVRFAAAHQLATWHAFVGDTDAALGAIRAVERVAPGYRDHKLRWMKEGFIRLARGETAAARDAWAAYLDTTAGRADPEASLALANGLGDDTGRLAQINRVLARAGLAPLERIDAGRPLGIDNIRARPAPHPGGLGRVSVIMPAYAAAHCIDTALRSLAEQSYPDLEILVVDDASPDATAAVVEAWAARDPRIRLLRQAANGGAYAARNRGLAAATGDFITTHDTDDWSHPQKIATQVDSLAAHPEIAAVCAHWVRAGGNLEIRPRWRISRLLLHWSHSSLMMRRGVIDALGPWDPVRVGADSEMIQRMQAAYGERALGQVMPAAPLAFALDEETSLTRTKATHVRTLYFGLRQVYQAVARHSHAAGEPAARRLALLPPELSGDWTPYELDFLLIADCCDPAILAEVEAFAASPEVAGARLGLFHWPDFAKPPAEFCPAYSGLLARGVRAVLPTAEVVLPRRFGIFFGTGHEAVDQFPTLLAEASRAPRAAARS